MLSVAALGLKPGCLAVHPDAVCGPPLPGGRPAGYECAALWRVLSRVSCLGGSHRKASFLWRPTHVVIRSQKDVWEVFILKDCIKLICCIVLECILQISKEDKGDIGPLCKISCFEQK